MGADGADGDRERAAVLLTGTGHVREDDVDVDFQFVSSRRVDVQLRVNLQGNASVNATVQLKISCKHKNGQRD